MANLRRGLSQDDQKIVDRLGMKMMYWEDIHCFSNYRFGFSPPPHLKTITISCRCWSDSCSLKRKKKYVKQRNTVLIEEVFRRKQSRPFLGQSRSPASIKGLP